MILELKAHQVIRRKTGVHRVGVELDWVIIHCKWNPKNIVSYFCQKVIVLKGCQKSQNWSNLKLQAKCVDLEVEFCLYTKNPPDLRGWPGDWWQSISNQISNDIKLTLIWCIMIQKNIVNWKLSTVVVQNNQNKLLAVMKLLH